MLHFSAYSIYPRKIMSERNNIAVHRTHCCVIHGCKYNDEHCPVANGQIKQEYVCRDCNELKGWNCMDEVKAEVKKSMGGSLPYVTPDQYKEHWADDDFPKNVEQQSVEDRVAIVDNIQDAENIKNGMCYPLLIRSIGGDNGYAYITDDEAFIIHANRKFRESPVGTIGITDDDTLYVPDTYEKNANIEKWDTVKTNFDNMKDIGVAMKDIPYHWGALPTAKDYTFVEGKGEMTILDKLHSIENSEEGLNAICDIHYSEDMGVAIIYRSVPSESKYYSTFEDCIDGEYERLLNLAFKEDEEDKFNNLCRGIYKEYYGVLSLGYFKPWTDNSQLLDVVDIVRKRTGIGLHVMGNEDVYDGMRNYVKEYGNGEFWEDDESYDTDDWTLTKEEQFNTNCAILVDGYNIFDCQPVTSDFDPYNNIEDLAPILPIVVRRVQEDFTLGEIMYDLPREDSYNMNVFDNMRHYIERHMQPLLDILDNDVDPR